MKYDSTTAAVSLTVFNFALETGPPPRSPAAGPPVAFRARVLITRRGTREEASEAPSTVVHAVPHDPVDDGHLPELVDATAVEFDPEVILRSRISSGLREMALCSADTTSAPEKQSQLLASLCSYGALGHVPPSTSSNVFSSLWSRTKSITDNSIWFFVPYSFEHV